MIIIADDITGAAEIAGMACDDTKVIATDTRSLSQDEAEAELHRVISKHNLKKSDCIFKKTDSALRGHIVAELKVLMHELSYDKCLLLPQNPSKGRVIRQGKYYINNVLLHETDFSNDPEYPATSSDVTEILTGAHYLSLNAPLQKGINIAEATDANEIEIQLNKTDGNTLIAGAADLFKAINPQPPSHNLPPTTNNPQPIIVVCGSTQSKSLADTVEMQRLNAQEIPMESDVFHGRTSADSWIDELKKAYSSAHAVVLTIGHPSEGGKGYAVRLRNVMAEAVKQLVEVEAPKTLIIEGGATAFAVLSSLGWSQFFMEHEYAPGVVALNHKGTHIILKPGSYPWSGIFTIEN